MCDNSNVSTTSNSVSLNSVQTDSNSEHWMKSFWRPAMAWLYMIICFMDFVGFPLISMFMPIILKGSAYVAWQSLTLSNGGLIHLAFGAILGVSAWTRGNELTARANNNQ